MIKCNTNQDFEKIVLDNNFPWFYQQVSTSDQYPFLSHTLIPRYDLNTDIKINSDFWFDISQVFYETIEKYNIKLDKICRASLNLTNHSNKFLHNDPHIDHNFPHKNFLFYLNNFNSGYTYIFDKKYDGVNMTLQQVPEIKEVVKPKKGDIIIFDGLDYHAQGFCDINQWRCVLVVTFTEKNNENTI